MSSLLLAIMGTANADSLKIEAGECNYHIQLAHVQDATDTFANDILDLQQNDLIEHLITKLQAKYPKVDYALATFKDKAGPFTGFGPTGGFWSEKRWEDDEDNHCYQKVQSFTDDITTANTAFAAVHPLGGKDWNENQWDALRRVANDDNIGWNLADFDEDGNPIIRFAVMVTDDTAHTAPETHAGQKRNGNAEYFRDHGPWQSIQHDDFTQKCDPAAQPHGNDINNNWMPGSEPANAQDSGRCYGWSANRAGTTRSLAGMVGHMNFNYGFGEVDGNIGTTECNPGGYPESDSSLWPKAECQKYTSFMDCCTTYGVSEVMRCSVDIDGGVSHGLFPDINACIAYGGKYARCHPDQKKADGSAYEQSIHNGGYRFGQCIEDTPEWLIAKEKEPSAEFTVGIGSGAFWSNTITEYLYDAKDIDEKDCDGFEYPDPTDPRYIVPFAEKNIIPVVLASPPLDKIVENADQGSIVDYTYASLRLSSQNCPGLKNDPYTRYLCKNPSMCYDPAFYPDLFVPEAQDNSGTPWWTQASQISAEDETAWIHECMDLEWNVPVQKMKDNGLPNAYYYEMHYEHNAELIVDKILEAIENSVTGRECPVPPTTTAEPTTTTAEATTTEATTTEIIVPTTEIIVPTTEIIVPPIIVTTAAPTEPPTTEVIVPTTEIIVPPIIVTTAAPTDPPTTTTKAPPITTAAPTNAPTTQTDDAVVPGGVDTGAIVGIACGGLVVLGGGVAAAVLGKKKHAGSHLDDVDLFDDEIDHEQITEVDQAMFL